MENKNETDVSEKVGRGEKLAYGAGDCACNMINTITSSLLSYFYTNVVGLSITSVGMISGITRVFDGVSDVSIGFMIDRTKSKHGKARPWILYLTIPFVLSAIALIAIPAGLSTTAKLIYAFITYNLATTIMYTAVNIPYGTLNSLMSRDIHERSSINIYRTTMATVGSMIVSGITLPLINKLGGTQKNWLQVTCIYAVIAAILLFICFKGTKERVHIESAKGSSVPIKTVLKCMSKNKYWLLLVLMGLIYVFGMVLSQGVATYYTQYFMGSSSYSGYLGTASTFPALIAIPLCAPLIKKFGKRNVCMGGIVIFFISTLIMIAGAGNFPLMMLSSVVKGVGFAAYNATTWAMIADTIEYGQWKTGIRTEGTLYSANTFGGRCGMGLASAISGLLLGKAGYDGMAAVQTESAMHMISSLYLYVPVIMAVLMFLCLIPYHLDRDYNQIMDDLRQRESAGL